MIWQSFFCAVHAISVIFVCAIT